MTKKELSQIYYLRREIELDKALLDQLEDIAENAASISAQRCADEQPDRFELANAIAQLKGQIEEKTAALIAEFSRLMQYLNGIEDSFVRQVFSLRYITGMSWNQVAHTIGNNTADSVRMAHNRYLKKHK